MTAEWLSITSVAEYAEVSPRTVRNWMKRGLRYSRLPTGTVRIKKQWVDEYLEKVEATEDRVKEVVNDVMSGL